jgi:hypothetical protein
VYSIAPRIDGRLLEALAALDHEDVPIAETHRRLGRLARRYGLQRPSYEQVRVHINELRLERENARRRRAELRADLYDAFVRPQGPERAVFDFGVSDRRL